MKKAIAIALICFTIFSALFVGCTKKEAKVDNSLEELKARGEFVLGLDDSFPPLGFRDDNNNIVGYDIDLASEVCKRLGVTLRCQPIDWAAKEQELNQIIDNYTGKIAKLLVEKEELEEEKKIWEE